MPEGDIMESTKAIRYARNNRERYIVELKELLAIPSISTLSQHKPDIQRAAEWLTRQMTDLGLQTVEILPTAGHPVVYAEWLGVPGKPTVLVYGHYDVQPADPLNEWTSPPFEPTVRGENIHRHVGQQGADFRVSQSAGGIIKKRGIAAECQGDARRRRRTWLVERESVH